jgi:hypothetical protein
MVVVYDPNGGFVTGGGWIPSSTGEKANFGFVAKYKAGTATPEGQVKFQLKTPEMDFKASSYDWLVITGPKAQFAGTGTIDGQGAYRFTLTAEYISNGDTFRIQIWNADGSQKYDSGTKGLGGGSIIVHS